MTALNATESVESPDEGAGGGCLEFSQREQQLASLGLDVQSCVHFLHYIFSPWVRRRGGAEELVSTRVQRGNQEPKYL